MVAETSPASVAAPAPEPKLDALPADSTATAVAENVAEAAKPTHPKKSLKFLGLEVSASERTAKRAFVGATTFLVVINGLGLPFILPKLRRYLGAPYVPMKRAAVEVLFDRVLPTWAASRRIARGSTAAGSGPLAGLRLVDFGSGDGRIVAAAASRGMHAVGFELNPYLWFWSRLRTRRLMPSLNTTPSSGSLQLRWANAWTADLRNVDVVTVYGRPGDGLMERTAEKCEKELPPHAAVISHFFDIPGWERLLVQDVEGLKLYDLSLLKRGPTSASQSAARTE